MLQFNKYAASFIFHLLEQAYVLHDAAAFIFFRKGAAQ